MDIREGSRIEVNVLKQVHCAITGELLREEKAHNLVVDAGLNLENDFLNSLVVTGIERFAIGTGSTAVSSADTSLVTEVFRDQFTQITKGDKTTDFKYFLASGSANGNIITEAGLFANGATDVAGSGTLYARVVLLADEKTSAEAWTFTWTVSRTSS